MAMPKFGHHITRCDTSITESLTCKRPHATCANTACHPTESAYYVQQATSKALAY